MRCDDGDFLRIFPSAVVYGRKPYLYDLRIVFPAFLESACDGRKRIHTLFLGFFLEIGIYLDGEDIRLHERESAYEASAFRDIILDFPYLDIGIMSIDLVFQEFRISTVYNEKEAYDTADIRHLETEFGSGIGFSENIFVFLDSIMEDIQYLFRHENPLFIEAVDGYFENGFIFIQMFVFNIRARL